jgi:hypothetical protein
MRSTGFHSVSPQWTFKRWGGGGGDSNSNNMTEKDGSKQNSRKKEIVITCSVNCRYMDVSNGNLSCEICTNNFSDGWSWHKARFNGDCRGSLEVGELMLEDSTRKSSASMGSCLIGVWPPVLCFRARLVITFCMRTFRSFSSGKHHHSKLELHADTC